MSILNNTTELQEILETLSNKASITPSGSLDITENGTFDVTNYASAVVNVPSSGNGSGKDTVTVTINTRTAYTTARYFDENGVAIEIANGNNVTVEALNGFVYLYSPNGLNSTGDYVYMSPTNAYYLLLFLSDGGTVSGVDGRVPV